MEIVRAEWRARTLGEYRAAAMSAEWLAWLMRLGFSSTTLAAAHKWTGDLLDHADLCWEVFSALGGDGDPLAVPEGALVVPHEWGQGSFERAAAYTIDVLCIQAVLAAPLWKALAEPAKEPAPRKATERIAKDADAHKEFGLTVLDEALEIDGDVVRRLAKARLHEWLGAAEAAWGYVPDDWIEPVGPHESRYALQPRARYKREFYQAIAESVLPPLDARNLSARAAWTRRARPR
jgi:hypothetical protein